MLDDDVDVISIGTFPSFGTLTTSVWSASEIDEDGLDIILVETVLTEDNFLANDSIESWRETRFEFPIKSFVRLSMDGIGFEALDKRLLVITPFLASPMAPFGRVPIRS